MLLNFICHFFHTSITVTPFTTVYPSLKLSAFNIFKMDLHALLLALPNILTSPQCSSPFIGSKLNSRFNRRSSPLHTTSSSRTRSSDHLCLSLPHVSTRLKCADRSFRNSSPAYGTLYQKLKSFTADTHHSTTVISFTPSQPCRALSLSRNQFLSCLKTHLFTLSYPT